MSATTFLADGIHEVLTFMFLLSICKCIPCAQRSKGAFVHRAVSIQVFAVVLSISSVVILPLQNSVNVSSVISAAKNSATLISAAPGLNPGVGTMVDHSPHEICQNRPARPEECLLPCANVSTPAIPYVELASLARVESLTVNLPNTYLNPVWGFLLINRR